MKLSMVVLLLAGACGGAHMDDAYGRRVRSALDANIAKGDSGGAIVFGDDARTILMRHRGLESTSTLYKSSGMSGAGASSSSSGPGTSATPSSTGKAPISLDAVR
jgi:hypothetical protein